MEAKRVGTLLIVGLVVLSAMVVFAGTAAAVTYPIWFEGYITDAGGNGIDGVKVKIINTEHPTLPPGYWMGTTDLNGYYKTNWAQIDGTISKAGTYKLYLYDPPIEVETRDLAEIDFNDEGGGCLWSYTWNYQIPEFSTIAIPIASILGLLFFFNRRKHRNE